MQVVHFGHGLAGLRGDESRVGTGKSGGAGSQADGAGVLRWGLGVEPAVGHVAVGVVTADTVQNLAGGDLQPVVVAIGDAPAVGQQGIEHQRRVGGHDHTRRAIRLYRYIAENFQQPEAAAAVGDIVQHLVVGFGHGL